MAILLAHVRGAMAETVWFDELQKPTTLTDSQVEAALQQLVAWWSAGANDFHLPIELDAAGPHIVFLTAGDGLESGRTRLGSGESFGSALRAAAVALRTEVADRPLKWWKLDVVDQVRPQTIDFDYQLPWDITTWGFALESSPGVSAPLALLAEELTDGGFVSHKLTPSRNRVVDYLRRQGRDPAAARPLYDVTPSPGYLFTTRGYLLRPAGSSARLDRGRDIRQTYSATELQQSLTAAANYLTSIVGPDGKFEYCWDPATGQRAEDYNLVRHAGTLYTMYELYGWSQDADLWEAAERARRYLLAQLVVQPQGDLPALCAAEEAPEGQVTKLGGTALAAVALAKRAEVADNTDDLETLRLLGNWIVGTQTAAGQFAVHKQVLPDGQTFDFDSIYYPGEAVLALTRIHRVLPDARWLKAAHRGADWLITVRDADLATDELPHDHWLLYSLADLYPEFPEPHYLRHAQRLVGAMARSQHGADQPADWQGGWYDPPRSTPTATRAEALLAAWDMLREIDPATADMALQSARHAVPFQLRAQYTPENSLHLAAPRCAAGGFRGSLVESWIRNDYVQHSASSILALLVADEALNR